MKTRWAWCISMTLSACAGVPGQHAPDPQTSAQALAARRLDDSGLAGLEARFGLPADPGAAWTPDRIVVAAWYFDPVLAQARAAAARAQADATLAAQRANPTLELSPEKVFSGGSAVSPWTIGVAVLLPLLHPGEAAARSDVVAADTQAARDQEAEAVWQSRARAMAALRGVLLARRAQKLAQDAARDQAAYLVAARRRVAAGEDDRGADLAAEFDAQRAKADLAARRAQRIAAEHALARAIGVPVAAVERVTLSWPGLEAPPAPSALPAAALAQDAAWNRLDLAALLARYRATAAQLRAAAGSRYPAMSVAPGYLYDQGQRKFTFGINVELPLFHGAGASIRAAAATRDEAAAAVRTKQSEILNDLDAARADYAERYAAWRRMVAAAKAARRVAARARALRVGGQGDRRAELAAQAAAASTRLAAQDALSVALAALGKLENALQRPLWPTSNLPAASAASESSRFSIPEASNAHAH